MPPEVCPNCGANIPARARACPECGADEQTGWSEDAQEGALGLPDDTFDYQEFTERGFGKKRPGRIMGIKMIWQVVAVLLVIGFVYLLWRRWL